MKYIVQLIFMLSIVHYSNAQQSGEIIYEDKVNIHARIPEEYAEFKAQIPEFRTENMILLFNETSATYKAYKTDDDEREDVNMHDGGGRRFRMQQMRSNHIVYQNYQEGSRIEQRDFMDKLFLIEGEPNTYAWKMTGETKDVGSYTAHLATWSDSTQDVKAWFVPEIAVPLGPAEYGQLPGLILHVDINDGERTLTATSIDLKEIDPSLLEKPTKGKKITQEEFDEIREEKMKEMRESGRGPGGFRVMTRRN